MTALAAPMPKRFASRSATFSFCVKSTMSSAFTTSRATDSRLPIASASPRSTLFSPVR